MEFEMWTGLCIMDCGILLRDFLATVGPKLSKRRVLARLITKRKIRDGSQSNLKCLYPTIFPVTYANTFLLTAVAFFSDFNIDGCCDDHGFPLFVLSLLESHNSASLCVVLLNKIRFV